MSGERIEQAVQRIEQALARIAEIAEKPRSPSQPSQGDEGSGDGPAMPASVSQLVVRHEELRETVAAEIRRLDSLIGRLGK